MYKVKVAIISLLVLLAVLIIATSVKAELALVTRVIDGDTIEVTLSGKTESIRLYGIDAPEKKQAYGLSAKDFVEVMVGGKMVDILLVGGKDRYERPVAIVMYGTQNLQEQLLLAGYAWVYPQYCRKSFCTAWSTLQGISAGNRVGLWASPAPVRPWEWRKAQ